MIIWQEWGDSIEHSSFIKAMIEFVARKEKITAAINFHPATKGPYTEREQPAVFIPKEGSLQETWQAKSHLSTLGRMRTHIIKRQDIPRELKIVLCIFSDVLHEFGHLKYHYNARGKSLLDRERYKKDLEYRLRIEQEAEAMVTKWFGYFDFYQLINDATKLD